MNAGKFVRNGGALVVSVCLAAIAGAKPLNVLFIAVDDLRPELSSYGADQMITPNISRLAEKAMRFENAYCQYPVCNPSRSSFLSGLRPDELGILSNEVALRQKWPDLVTLPQAFRDRGYFTAGIGKLFHAGLDEEGDRTFFRDDVSFEHFYSARRKNPAIGNEGEGRHLGDGTVGWAHWRAAEGGDLAQVDGMLAADAVRVIAENRDKPFFIALGFHKPHDPFVAPKEYFEMYPYDEVTVEDDPDDRTPLLEHSLPDSYNFPTFTEDDRIQFKRAYMACTTFVDAQLGKVLDTLDQLELWDETIVVFLGDHGYHLGEHGWWNKVTVFDIGARVPLMIWVPGSDGEQRTTKSVVELLDLYPTLLDYAGIEAPHELSGKSLRPVLEDSSLEWEEPAFTQVRRGGVGMGYSVRMGDWRLVQWGEEGEGGFELFDVTKDREGFYNLAGNPEYAGVKQRLRAALKENYSNLE